MYKVILLVVISLAIVNLVHGEAGFIKPIPVEVCDTTHAKGCSIRTPCKERKSDNVNPVYFNGAYDIVIYQKEAQLEENSTNTYSLEFFPDGDGSNKGLQIITFNQNDFKDGSIYSVKLEAFANYSKLKELIFDSKNHSYGLFQLTFDARHGDLNTKPYYSCAFVRFQKTQPSSAGKSILVNTAFEATGNVTTEIPQGNTTISIPGLETDTTRDASDSIYTAQDDDDDQKSHEKSSASRIYGFPLSILLVSLLTYFHVFIQGTNNTRTN